MKKPNTKMHWTALALTRYYNKFDEAARVRDLYPFVQDIHEKPDSLVSTLSNLKAAEVVGFASVTSTRKGGGGTTTFAYYPTNITIDRLRDVGEPTKMPDGSPVPEEVDTSLPTDRVTAEEEDDVNLPTDTDTTGLDYVNMGGDRSRKTLPSSEYDTSDIEREDGVIETTEDEDLDDFDDDEGDDADEDEDDHRCPYCGETFPSGKALGGHKTHCKPDPDEITHDFDPSWGDVEDALDFVFQSAFESDGVAGDGDVEIKPEPEYEGMLDEMADDEDDDEDLPEASDEDVAKALNEFNPMKAINTDSLGYSPREASRKLSRRADRAFEADLYDIATSYSQFAELAEEGELEKRTLEILLGQPILEQERDAQTAAN